MHAAPFVALALAVAGPPALPDRPPVNACLAIDRSASMKGDRMLAARVGALVALWRLRPTDLVSVVAYDDVVEVLVPATRAAEHDRIEPVVRALQPRGGAALFPGVVKCAAELRRFASTSRVNRIVVLSHGNATVGPSAAADLGGLGAQLRQEGISVITIGVGRGYNQGPLRELAQRSAGGHAFVAEPEELAGLFDDQLAVSSPARPTPVAVRAGAVSARPVAHGRPAPPARRPARDEKGATQRLPRNILEDMRKTITNDPTAGADLSSDDPKLKF
jgi:Ca-activated chloride channel family protein